MPVGICRLHGRTEKIHTFGSGVVFDARRGFFFETLSVAGALVSADGWRVMNRRLFYRESLARAASANR